MRSGKREHLMPQVQTDCPQCFGDGMLGVPNVVQADYLVTCPCGASRWKPGSRFGGYVHPQTYLRAAGRVAMVDEGIASDVAALWEAGIWTWVSCQGDEAVKRYVALLDASQVEQARALLPWVATVVDRTGDVGDVILESLPRG